MLKTMAGNDVNGDLERRKHCMKGVSWESGWQWIKMRPGTIEHKLLTTFTASTRCWCEKKEKKKALQFDYLDLWAVAAKAAAHLDVTKPHHTEMGGWTLTHGLLSHSDICLHWVFQMFPARLLLILSRAKGLLTCLSSQLSAGARPLGPIKCVYLRPQAESNLATRLNHIPNVIIC